MKWLIVFVIVVAILVVGYFERHTVKVLMMGSSQTANQVAINTPGPAMDAQPTASPIAAVFMTAVSPQKGRYLTDGKGMALYTYDKDTKDKSNCTGVCLTNWPPFLEASD